MLRVCLCSFAHGMHGILDGSFYIIFPAKTYKKSLVYVSPVREKRCLLGCYAESSGNSLPTSRDNLWVPSSRGQETPNVNINIFCTERRHVSVFSVEDSQVVASCLQNRSALSSSPRSAVSHVLLGTCMIFMRLNSHSYVVLTSYFSGT